jgi:hypothetical protein
MYKRFTSVSDMCGNFIYLKNHSNALFPSATSAHLKFAHLEFACSIGINLSIYSRNLQSNNAKRGYGTYEGRISKRIFRDQVSAAGDFLEVIYMLPVMYKPVTLQLQ